MHINNLKPGKRVWKDSRKIGAKRKIWGSERLFLRREKERHILEGFRIYPLVLLIRVE
jgi:hypothetical protein